MQKGHQAAPIRRDSRRAASVFWAVPTLVVSNSFARLGIEDLDYSHAAEQRDAIGLSFCVLKR